MASSPGAFAMSDNSQLSPDPPKEIQEVFRELLQEKNVSSNASWEYAIKLIGNDSRYELFRHHPERKQMFSVYKTQKAKDEKEEQRIKLKRSKENFEKMLQTSDKISSVTRYRQAQDLFQATDVWKAVAEQDRREIFRDVTEHLAIKEKEETKTRRKRNMKVLSDILDAMPSITNRTTWKEAQQLLLDNTVFSDDAELLGMDKEDALIVFEDHIRQLDKEEDEEKKREKIRTYRSQRKNREAFIRFLDQLHVQGRLTSISKWCHLYPEISADPRFTALLSQPLSGSTPLDLFKYYVEDFKARFEEEKLIIRDILKKQNFDVNIDTTYDVFADVVSKDERSSKLDAGNVKMVYEKSLEKVREKVKERLREESKKQKKLEYTFMQMLHEVEPAIDEKTDWEVVRKKVVDNEIFETIETEPARVALFHAYKETLQESCSHHHSKSKKKKDKRREEKGSRRRSPSSSRSDSEDDRKKGRRRRSRSYDRRRRSGSSGHSSHSPSRSKSRDRRDRPSRKGGRSRTASSSRSLSPAHSRSPSSEQDVRRRDKDPDREKRSKVRASRSPVS